MGNRKIIARIPLMLARDEIWGYPTEIILVHHDAYSYNGHCVNDLIQMVMADAEDVDFLESGYEDSDDPVDPGDLSGDSVGLMPQDMRALANALLQAANAMEAE